MSTIAAEPATAPEMLETGKVNDQSLTELQKLNMSTDELDSRRESDEAAAAQPHRSRDRGRKRSSISMSPESFDALLMSVNAESDSLVQRALADRIVRWARYAKRAMTPDELFEAVASNPIATEEAKQEAHDLNDTLAETCRKLVRLDEKKSLQHFLEGAYLKQRWLKSKEQASAVETAAVNVELAKMCINYLNRPDISHSKLSRRKLKRACNAYPFLEYAMKYWRRHLLDDEDILYPEVAPLADSLLEETPSNTLLYDGLLQTLFRLKLLHRDEWATISSNIAVQPYLPPQYKLHYAIALHLPTLVEKYAEDQEHIFSRLPQGDLPLTWALRRTSKRMTRILLRQSAREQIIGCLDHAHKEQTAIDAKLRAREEAGEAPEEESRDSPDDPSSAIQSPPTDAEDPNNDPAKEQFLRRSSTLMTTEGDDSSKSPPKLDLHRFSYAPFLLKILLEAPSGPANPSSPTTPYNISPEFLLRHCIRSHTTPRSIFSAPDCIDTFLSHRALSPTLYSLHLACRYSAFPVVNYLLSNPSIDPSLRDPAGQNILHLAVQHPNFSEARLIVDELLHLHHADPGSRVPGPGERDREGRTLLHLAAGKRMLGYLLGSEDVGLGVEERDRKGRTVLHSVVGREGGDVGEVKGMVDLVIEAGGDVGAKDAEGRTAREVAQEKWAEDEVIMNLLDEKRERKEGKLARKTW